ncbi:hypothetical protein GARC_0767 [Paraglaciecola arctica BSs20135]|uniref:Uncharacterized protein n=1 Tax=Paraglaciecola arctica BSs20135 TaxID=493475 RepID=K6YM74_9ALTE|nr:hypothetical protein GARC_0767 [Paraglaciecola arctica BSs20135]
MENTRLAASPRKIEILVMGHIALKLSHYRRNEEKQLQ